jgi:hypothetical protein
MNSDTNGHDERSFGPLYWRRAGTLLADKMRGAAFCRAERRETPDGMSKAGVVAL